MTFLNPELAIALAQERLRTLANYPTLVLFEKSGAFWIADGGEFAIYVGMMTDSAIPDQPDPRLTEPFIFVFRPSQKLLEGRFEGVPLVEFIDPLRWQRGTLTLFDSGWSPPEPLWQEKVRALAIEANVSISPNR